MKPPIQNISIIREQKNMSRDEVAEKLGVTVSLYGKLERGQIGVTLERLYELADIFDIPAEEILTLKKKHFGNAYFVPLDFQTTFLSGKKNTSREALSSYNLPFLDGTDHFIISITNDSMYPTIKPGDRIIVSRVKDMSKIVYGRIYAVVHPDGCCITRVYSSKKSSHVMLRADNSVYEPIMINRKSIFALWVVKDYAISHLIGSR